MNFVNFNIMKDGYIDTSNIKNKCLNLAYGNQSERQKLDIYYPETFTEEPYKTIVFVHGGAFIKGDKGRYQLSGALQGVFNGYAVISVNYRFIHSNPFPAYVCDVKAAMRYLAHFHDALNIDVNNMTIWGESVGGYLAILAGITDTSEVFEDYSINEYREKIKFKQIVDWYGGGGPLSIEEAESYEDIISVLDIKRYGRDSETKRKLKMMSAIENYLHDDMPSLLIQHGSIDSCIPLNRSIKLKQLYEKYNKR